MNHEKLAQPILVIEQKDELRYSRNKFKEYKYVQILCQLDKNLQIIDETNYDSSRMKFISINKQLDKNNIVVENSNVSSQKEQTKDLNKQPIKKQPIKKQQKKRRVKNRRVNDVDDEQSDDEQSNDEQSDDEQSDDEQSDDEQSDDEPSDDEQPETKTETINSNEKQPNVKKYEIIKFASYSVDMDEIEEYIKEKNVIPEQNVINEKQKKTDNKSIKFIADDKHIKLLMAHNINTDMLVANDDIDRLYCIFDKFWDWIKTLEWNNVRNKGDCRILIKNTIDVEYDELFIDDIQYGDNDIETKLKYYYYTNCIKYFTQLFLFKLNTHIPVLVNNEPPAYIYQNAIQNIIGVGWETYKTLYTSIETFLFILNENERICEVDFSDYYFKIKDVLKI